MTAPAMIPAIAPPERPLLVVAATFVCGVDVGEVGDADTGAAREVIWDEDTGGASDCVVVEGADEVDGVVAGEDGVAEEEVGALLEEWVVDVAGALWLDAVVAGVALCWVVVVVPLAAAASIGKDPA